MDTFTTGVLVNEVRCYRCTHIWVPRKASRPITCPNCNSAYWYRPKGLKTGESPPGKPKQKKTA